MIDRTRVSASKSTTERSYYITSLGVAPKKLSDAIRSHWGIENQLHWVLDVVFAEDSRKIRDERSAENFACVSRLALMLLKRSPAKLSVNLKRKRAVWDHKYFQELIFSSL